MTWTLTEEKSLLEIYTIVKATINTETKFSGKWDKAKALWQISLDIDHDWESSKMRLQNIQYCDTKRFGLSNAAEQTKKLVDEWKASPLGKENTKWDVYCECGKYIFTKQPNMFYDCAVPKCNTCRYELAVK